MTSPRNAVDHLEWRINFPLYANDDRRPIETRASQAIGQPSAFVTHKEMAVDDDDDGCGIAVCNDAGDALGI